MKELHQRTQFVELTGNTPDKLATGVFGKAGSGKSRLLCTMPGKTGVIPLDRKTRRTLERVAVEMALPKGKIVMPKEDFIRVINPMKLIMMEPDAQMKFYRDHFNKVKDAIWTLAEDAKVESIGIDTGSQMAEDCLFANYGRDSKIYPRDRGAFNSELKQLFASISHKQVLVTHESRAIWKNDKPTDNSEWVGWSKLDYNTNVIVELTGPPDTKKLDHQFGLTIRLSQDRPDLIGETILTDELISWEMLATYLYPEGNWG